MSRRRKGRGATAAPPPPRRRRGRLRRLLLLPVKLAAVAALLILAWVAAYRVIDPPGGVYMLSERLRLGGIEREWRDIGTISPALVRAVMASEDARFCDHRGFDVEAIREALESNRAGGGVLRGGSTISQQVSKNVFLWHGRSWARKGLEAAFTLPVELIWPKRRIMEVYLNTAEFAPGVFGAEAGARHHFGRTAADLTMRQASLLAAVLPNPRVRDASAPSAHVERRARAAREGAETLRATGRDACVL